MRQPLLLLLFVFMTACAREAPIGILGGEDVLFHDEFVAGQMGQWQLEGDALGQSSIVNEQLFIDLDESNMMQFSALSEQNFQDFILEVDAWQVQGDPANSYGILFRMQDPNRFYRFEITGNGFYMLERRNGDGSWTRFVQDWTAAEAIQAGHNARNTLRVEAIGPLITVSVNGMQIQQVNDNLYPAGQIALDAGTFGSPEMQAAFDNVVIRQP